MRSNYKLKCWVVNLSLKPRLRTVVLQTGHILFKMHGKDLLINSRGLSPEYLAHVLHALSSSPDHGKSNNAQSKNKVIKISNVNLDVHWGQVKNGLLIDPVIPV